MHSLPIFVRLQGRPVILIGDGEAADAKRRLLERAGAVVVGEEAEARLAIVAEADPAPVVARLRARGILVNAVDHADLCDFMLPAIVDRDPVLIAVGTGGTSAGLAAALRQRLENLLPPSIGRLAVRLKQMRNRIREKWPDPVERRHALTHALQSGERLDFMTCDPETDVDGWLSARPERSDRTVESIWLSSNDPDDLKLHDARLLAAADAICHDPEIGPAILLRARADASVRPVEAWPEVPTKGLFLHIHWAG